MSYPCQGISSIVAVNRKLDLPLHRQVYQGYRVAILGGSLKPGQLVPSSREFAVDHGVSRFPVLHAYAQLLAEGYFESRTGAGTFIASSLPERLLSARADTQSARRGISGPRTVSRRSELFPPAPIPRAAPLWGAFGVHQPAFDQFPFRIWSTLLNRHSRNPSVRVVHNIDPLGSRRFREAICDYVRSSRAVRCEPEQIMVVSGSQ
jgi:GntR family transcriptional regulator / MocR family aminotransferase